jgi:hypothetical protein
VISSFACIITFVSSVLLMFVSPFCFSVRDLMLAGNAGAAGEGEQAPQGGGGYPQ